MESLLPDLPEEKKGTWIQLQKFFESIVTGEVDSTTDEWKPLQWKGHRFMPTLSPDTARKYFEEVKIEENTVILATFPKTGMNWTSDIIYQILYGHDEKSFLVSKGIPPMLGMIEMWKPESVDLLEHIPLPRKLLTTHLPAELVDFEKIRKAKAKIVIPIRNPKDQAVSWFHFSKILVFNAIRDELHTDWPQFFLDYVHGKHPINSKSGEWYPDYLRGWYEYKDEPNVFFMHFEDMRANPKREIRKLADFLEVPLTDEQVADIAKKTSFAEMKKAQEEGGSVVSRSRAATKMIRRGQIGGWKHTFTVAQSELMDEIIERKLGDTDIKFRYE